MSEPTQDLIGACIEEVIDCLIGIARHPYDAIGATERNMRDALKNLVEAIRNDK